MKLSTKGRYAITAMMELALHHKEGPVTLADISAEQSISVSYLEQLFAQLRKHGLVTGLRGPGGGYCLRRAANEISIAQILRAVDDSTSQTQALATEDTAAETQPRARSLLLWDQLSDRIYGYLDGITLADAIVTGKITGEEPGKTAGDGMHRPAA
jgi:Rrf2 family iron-sulfur cluster assembly transcriptional regulator